MKLSVCILSWKSRRTLRHTLESYERNGLLRFADEKLIFFQQVSSADVRIARRFGLEWFGSERNVGIGAGYRNLAERATGDLVLFLQNDFVLIENLDRDRSELLAAMQALQDGKIDVALFRHRREPGLPHWAEDNVRGNESRWPSHLFNAIYWLENPERVYPQQIGRAEWDPRFLTTTSRHMNYTDNPSLYRRDWLLQTLGDKFVANGPDEITWPEHVIQPWWETQSLRIAQANGLFTHIRLDRHDFLHRQLQKATALLRWLRIYDHGARRRLAKELP